MTKIIKNIVVIGSGNVAFHLVNAFSMKGIKVLQILSSNEITAASLSENFHVPYTLEPSNLNREADLYILAVKDDQIREAAFSLGLDSQFLVHTSGFSPMSALNGASANTGVIWPLQTFTSGKHVEYGHIPIFIEANSDTAAQDLSGFAGLVSNKVMVTDSPTRQKIHLAAVIASNLSNHLYSIAESILAEHNIPFGVLAPLIIETAEKAGQQSPAVSQTGPAARKDLKVIEKHLDLLRDHPDFREIYRLITENIIQLHSISNEKL